MAATSVLPWLFLGLILAPPLVAAQPHDAGVIGGDAGIERAMSLFRVWEDIYGLKPGSALPPSAISLPPEVPPAPHLEDCHARTAFRLQTEQRGSGGEPPAWARPSNCCSCSPQPPWVRGSDSDNLALTRVVQRDLWQRQMFPGSCEGRRLLVVPWSTAKLHGAGSQIHLMSAFLSLALVHNRTLVPMPQSYDRATGDECRAQNKSGSWDCFFFPIVNSDCERLVSASVTAGTFPACSTADRGHDGVSASAAAVVCVDPNVDKQMEHEARAASLWGTAYSSRPDVVEYMGKIPKTEDKYRRVHWWRAQSTRFLMRWPSAHLCHVTNRERHTAYGLHVASHLARFAETRAQMLRAVAAAGGAPEANVGQSAEARMLLELSFAAGPTIETHVWGTKGRSFCGGGGSGGSGGSDMDRASNGSSVGAGVGVGSCDEWGSQFDQEMESMYVGVGGEVFVPRPMASLHVRQSDKGIEMRLSSFTTHMFFMYRLRRAAADLRYVWLNTEMESVLQEAQQYHDWKFFHSSNARQPVDAKGNREYEFSQSVSVSFASALIAAQCDYFVGALGSNWSRLVNELRATNGRLYAGFVAINMGDW